MTMRAYANKGWLAEQCDKLANIKTLAALSYEVSIMEESRPKWLADVTIVRLRKAYHIRHAILSEQLASGK